MGGTDTTSLTAPESSPCAGCVTSVKFTTSLGLSLPLKDVNQRTSDKRCLSSVVGGGFTRTEGHPGPSVNAPVGRMEAAGSRGWTSRYKNGPQPKKKEVARADILVLFLIYHDDSCGLFMDVLDATEEVPFYS